MSRSTNARRDRRQERIRQALIHYGQCYGQTRQHKFVQAVATGDTDDPLQAAASAAFRLACDPTFAMGLLYMGLSAYGVNVPEAVKTGLARRQRVRDRVIAERARIDRLDLDIRDKITLKGWTPENRSRRLSRLYTRRALMWAERQLQW